MINLSSGAKSVVQLSGVVSRPANYTPVQLSKSMAAQVQPVNLSGGYKKESKISTGRTVKPVALSGRALGVTDISSDRLSAAVTKATLPVASKDMTGSKTKLNPSVPKITFDRLSRLKFAQSSLPATTTPMPSIDVAGSRGIQHITDPRGNTLISYASLSPTAAEQTKSNVVKTLRGTFYSVDSAIHSKLKAAGVSDAQIAAKLEKAEDPATLLRPGYPGGTVSSAQAQKDIAAGKTFVRITQEGTDRFVPVTKTNQSGPSISQFSVSQLKSSGVKLSGNVEPVSGPYPLNKEIFAAAASRIAQKRTVTKSQLMRALAARK